MDPSAVAKALLDLGGWGAFLFVVALITFGAYRKWWVIGWVHEETAKRADRMTDQASKNAEALDRLSQALDRATRADELVVSLMLRERLAADERDKR